MDLVSEIYRYTLKIPTSELYGLTSQIRRSVVSIPANIAEGKLRGSAKEFLRFLRIAYSSGAELETHLEIAHRLDFIGHEEYEILNDLLEEIMKMLNGLMVKIRQTISNSS